jgi:hypothetical protein
MFKKMFGVIEDVAGVVKKTLTTETAFKIYAGLLVITVAANAVATGVLLRKATK